MKAHPAHTIMIVFILFLTMSGIVFAQVASWAPPHAASPGGVVNRLIDMSTTSQIKQGTLGIDTSPGNTLGTPSAGTGLYVNSESVIVQQTGAGAGIFSITPNTAIYTNGRIRSNGTRSTSVIQSDVLKAPGVAEKTVCVELATGKLKLCGIPLGPTITFTATPPSLTAAGNVTLQWTSNAVSCTGTNFSTGASSPPNGTRVVTVPTTRTYGVTCTDLAGQSASKFVTVVVAPAAPTASIVATPSTVNSGQTTSIAWTSANTASCIAIAPSPASFTTGNAVSGSQSFTLNNTGTAPGSVVFAIRCTSSSGSTVDANTTVTVNPLLPVVNFSAAPVN